MGWLVLIADMQFGEAFWIYMMTRYHRDESSGLPHTHRLDTGYNDDMM